MLLETNLGFERPTNNLHSEDQNKSRTKKVFTEQRAEFVPKFKW